MTAKNPNTPAARRKKAVERMMVAAEKNDWEAHDMIMETWMRICLTPTHDHYLGALKEYLKYVVGIPKIEVDVEARIAMTSKVDPLILAAAGIKVMHVSDLDEDGNTVTRVVEAAPREDG